MVAWIITALTVVLGVAIGRLLIGAGLALAFYTGVSGYVDSLLANISAQFAGLSADILQILALAGIGEGLSVMMATGSAVLSVKAASSLVGIRLA